MSVAEESDRSSSDLAGTLSTGAPGEPLVVIDRVTRRYRVPVSAGGRVMVDDKRGSRRFSRRSQRKGWVAVDALNESSAVVRRGEAVGVIGRNGSGKSTLMRIISGQEGPSSGAVHARSTPTMIGVNAALMPTLSGEQNVILGGLAMGLSRDQIDDRFDSVIELSGLADAIYRPLGTYSSGMTARLQFAIATSIDPEILLVDEALNTGDAQFGERSKRRMDQLRAQAGCVLLVSHALSTIRQMCTRVLWLDNGDLLMDGDPDTVTLAYSAFARALADGDEAGAARIRAEARADLSMPTILMEPRRQRPRH